MIKPIEISDIRAAFNANHSITTKQFASILTGVACNVVGIDIDSLFKVRTDIYNNTRKAIALIIKETFNCSDGLVMTIWREKKARGFVITRMLEDAVEIIGSDEFNPTFQNIMREFLKTITSSTSNLSEEQWKQRMNSILQEFPEKSTQWWEIKLSMSNGIPEMEKIYNIIVYTKKIA